jgi:hypothetical protein
MRWTVQNRPVAAIAADAGTTTRERYLAVSLDQKATAN